ncbi:GDSL-type esterase/lipase family protein, partial [Moorena sp. SIO3I6]|uniref:GDSL-type esterase/lipase family protein n=1 Tax=Moorena sp. SIO3I6 TaxID=2607831 RepID=UPI0013F98611
DLNSEIEDWLKQARPDIVLLMAGTNDILFQNESPEDTVNEMILLIDKILAWSDNVYLFVSSIPPINPSALQDGTIKNQKADKYNNLLANLLTGESYKNKNIRFLDNRDIFTPDHMLEDGIHLTSEGYKKLAQAWFKMMLGITPREKQDDSPIDVPVEIEIYSSLEKILQGKRIIKKLLIPDSTSSSVCVAHKLFA